MPVTSPRLSRIGSEPSAVDDYTMTHLNEIELDSCEEVLVGERKLFVTRYRGRNDQVLGMPAGSLALFGVSCACGYEHVTCDPLWSARHHDCDSGLPFERGYRAGARVRDSRWRLVVGLLLAIAFALGILLDAETKRADRLDDMLDAWAPDRFHWYASMVPFHARWKAHEELIHVQLSANESRAFEFPTSITDGSISVSSPSAPPGSIGALTANGDFEVFVENNAAAGGPVVVRVTNTRSRPLLLDAVASWYAERWLPDGKAAP